MKSLRLAAMTCLPVIAGGWAVEASPQDLLRLGRPALKVFNDRDGLPQNTIEAIVQDPAGRVWVATQDGAAVYDGNAWKALPLPDNQGSQWIRAMICARDGALWMGREQGGICVYRDGRWETHHDMEGLGHFRIQTLLERRDGTVLAGGPFGILAWRGGRWESFRDPLGQRLAGVNCFAEAPDGTLLVGTDAGLIRVRGDHWERISRKEGLAEDHIWSLLVPSRGQGLLVGTSRGLYRWEGQGWRALRPPEGPPLNVVTALVETTNGRGEPVLWAGTEGGLARLEGGSWRNYNMGLGFPSRVVRSLMVPRGREGSRNLWVGSFGGVIRIREGGWTAFDTSVGLPENVVFSMLDSRDERTFWMGTLGGGLVRFREGRLERAGGADGPTHVMSLLERGGRPGDLVVGTRGDGVLAWDGRRWSRMGHPEDLVDSWVYCLHEDPEGRLRAGTRNGLMTWREGRWVAEAPEAFRGVVVNRLLTVDGGERPRLFAATRGRGLLEMVRGQWRGVGEVERGVDARMMSLLAPRNPRWGRCLWIGTYQGLARLDLERPQDGIRSLHVPGSPFVDKAPIYQMVEDRNGRIFLFTTRGVLCVDQSPDGSLNAHAYTRGDGLPSNGCTLGSGMMDRRGRIWTGTVAGAACLEPDREVPDHEPKPLLMESPGSGGASFLPQGPLEVPWRRPSATFRFVLLSFHREEDTRYQSRLVGLESQPTEWGPDPKREFPSLPSGEYTFQVWGRDAAGNVSGPVQRVLRVPAPPWARWWAYLVYLGLGGLGLAQLIRTRTHLLTARAEMLETRVKERTRELQAARDEAQRANDAKSFLMASVSHDIRTPLHGVLGCADLILATPLDPSQRELAETLRRSGANLVSLLNDLLDLSRAEAQGIVLECLPFDPIAEVEDALLLFQDQACRKGVELAMVLGPALKGRMEGDPTRFRQVVVNLVSNALKFTSRGHVTVTIRLESAGGSSLCVEVADTGIGISADRLESLFNPYVQAEEGTYRKYGGTGLGLAICRRLAEAMGGAISVESQEGAGSRFRFTIPWRGAEETEAWRPLEGVHLLGLGPEGPGRAAVASLVTHLGGRTRWEDRAEALAELTVDAGVASVDGLVILGPEDPSRLARLFATLVHFHAGMRLVVAESGERAGESIHGHPVYHLALPATRKRLLEAFGLWASGQNDAAAAPPGEAGRVLLVDDNPLNLRIGRFHLEGLGWEVVEARSGEEALSHLEAGGFDLALMDCEMPGLDGFEVVRRFREREAAGSRLKILAMTAHSVGQATERALAAGMDGVFTKPFRPEDLARVLGSGHEMPLVRESVASCLDEGVWEGLEYIEQAAGPGALSELIGMFRLDAPERMGLMGNALGQGDRETLSRLAHDLKSNSATVGAMRLREVARDIEVSAPEAKESELLALIARAHEELGMALAAIEQRLSGR